MVTILNSDFLKFSELMGVKKKIMRKNATRNAILPNMTSFGISIGVSITGVIVSSWESSYCFVVVFIPYSCVNRSYNRVISRSGGIPLSRN